MARSAQLASLALPSLKNLRSALLTAVLLAISTGVWADHRPKWELGVGVIGLSTVSHDLPGRVGFLRVSYNRN